MKTIATIRARFHDSAIKVSIRGVPRDERSAPQPGEIEDAA